MIMTSCSDRWAIVLAGGDGRRCEQYCNHLYSDGRPKQFCALSGKQSLIEETLERVRYHAPPERTVVDVCRKHTPWRELWEETSHVRTSIQPKNADTGPAVLSTTMMIERESPRASIALFPSDHYVGDPLRFMGAVREASNWVDSNPDYIVALGVEASYPETEYGWLLPENTSTNPALQPQPARFVEKPSHDEAVHLLAQGALWNTSVLVYRSDLLLRLMEVFARDWWRALDRAVSFEDHQLDNIYSGLAPFNLSRDVLQHCPNNMRVLRVRNVQWCDLGSEWRIDRHHRQLKEKPSLQAKTSMQLRPGPTTGSLSSLVPLVAKSAMHLL